ncbi:MAG: hypothetical protein ACR2FN_13245 [Chitinophagaceae bacterium]
MELLNINYPQFFNEGIGGIIRSFAVAFIVIFITGFWKRKNYISRFNLIYESFLYGEP